jgi:hypothetical protein
MALTGFRFLEQANIGTLVQTLQTDLDMARPLTFLSRIPIVNAEDDEIFGRYSGQVFAADIITDDQEAVVYEGGQLETYRRGAIPKLKIGSRIGESMIRRLHRLSSNLTLAGPDQDLITGWENDLATRLVQGLRVRQNMLACAMMLDSLVYDRLGVRVTSGWGKPADLKVTLSGGDRWSTDSGSTANTAATPLADIRSLIKTAQIEYGQPYDRITLARKTFDFIVQTDEFFDAAKFLYRFDIPTGALDLTNTPNMITLFQALTGLTVEIEDNTYKERVAGGKIKSTRVLPTNNVMLSNSADDGDSSVMDFANGVVIEPIVAAIMSADAGEASTGDQYGPYAYYTGNQNLNPPDLACFATLRGFPRSHVTTATAVITAW